MQKVKLSVEEQIEILSIARENLSKTTDNDNNGFFGQGVCCFIYRVLERRFDIYELESIKEYIDGLTKANATRLSFKYGFDRPYGEAKYFWWTNKSKWNAPRLAFLEALITELKLQLV